MSGRTRALMALAGVVVIAVAIVLFSVGGDDEKNSSGSPATTQTGATPQTAVSGETPATGATGEETGGSKAGEGENTGGSAPGDDTVTTAVLKSGSIEKVTIKKGQTVIVRGRSDAADELHVHGYDVHAGLEPGKVGKVKFKANLTGVFEIEIEGTGEQVAELRVEP